MATHYRTPTWPKGWSVISTPPPAGAGPAPAGLLPGDLVFCSPIAPTLRQSAIMAAQGMVYGPTDSCFTHLGIYAGNGMAFDSAPKTGVSLRPFLDVTHGAYVRARRLAGVTPTMQWDICNEAAALNGRYSYAQAVTHGLIPTLQHYLPAHWAQLIAALLNGHQPANLANDDPLYCSQFVEVVMLKALNMTVLNGRNLVPLPAAFSDDLRYNEVAISW